MSIPVGFELKEKVAKLQEALLNKHPQMPVLLREIHAAIKAQPEQVTLLEEEEIQVIVKGLEKQTGVELATSVVKTSKSTSKTAQIKALGADAF